MKHHLNHIQSTFFVCVLCFALLFSVPSSHAVEAGTNTDSTGTTQTDQSHTQADQPHQDEQKPADNGTSDDHQNNATHDPPPDSNHEEEHHEEEHHAEGEEHDDYCEDLYDEIGARCGEDDGCWMEEQNNLSNEDRERCHKNEDGHEGFTEERSYCDELYDEIGARCGDDDGCWMEEQNNLSDEDRERCFENKEDHSEDDVWEDDFDDEEEEWDEEEHEEEHHEYEEEEEYDEHQIYAEFQHEFPCGEMIFKEAIDRCDAAGLSPEQCKQVVLPSVLENKMRDGRCGDGAHENFDEYEDEEPEHMEGCIPRFATLPEVKRNMHGADKSEVLAEFKKRKQWLSQEVSQNGGDPEEFLNRWDEMNICDDGPPGSHGPGGGQMGPPGPPPGMDHRGPGGGPHVGEVFGRAVGELVSRLQDPNLPDEVKQKMQKALAWFSAKVGEISNGADPKQFVGEAREILQGVMGHGGPGGGGMGPGGGRSGMPPPHAGEEIKRMLNMMHDMLEKLPQAFALMSEMGHEVEGWEEYLGEIQANLPELEDVCEAALGSEDPEAFRKCFDVMHEFFDGKMGKLEEFVSRSVPREVMDEVGRKMGFDDDHEEEDWEDDREGEGAWDEEDWEDQDYPEYPDSMGPPGMYDDPGDEELRRFVEDCKASGRPMEECKREAMERFEFHEYGHPGMMGPPTHMGPRPEQIMEECMADGNSEEECKEKVMRAIEEFDGMHRDPYGGRSLQRYDYMEEERWEDDWGE